jgi:hypothetical protein
MRRRKFVADFLSNRVPIAKMTFMGVCRVRSVHKRVRIIHFRLSRL